MKQLLTGENSSYTIFFATLFALLISGCQKPHDHIRKTVPLKAKFETVSTILQEGPPELDSIAGQGNGTPMGKSSFIAHAQFDADYNLTGIIALTTDDGDKFFASITGSAPDVDESGNITLHFKSTITGGAGKFAGATGNFDGVAHESLYSSAGNAEWDGTITY
jgi:hypothetical protein